MFEVGIPDKPGGLNRFFEFAFKDLKRSLKTEHNIHFGEKMTDTEIILTRDLVVAHDLLRQVMEVRLSERPHVVVKHYKLTSKVWYVEILSGAICARWIHLNANGDVVEPYKTKGMLFEAAYRVAKQWLDKQKVGR